MLLSALLVTCWFVVIIAAVVGMLMVGTLWLLWLDNERKYRWVNLQSLLALTVLYFYLSVLALTVLGEASMVNG